MKKLLLTLTVVALSVAACQSQTPKESATSNNETMNNKTLVAYFSASGVTRDIAAKLAQEAQADLYEITPVELYTDADLDWTNKQSRSSVEMNDLSSRPAITGTVDNIDQYDVVYIGFPIWWYTAPTIVNTFIEANNLTGKTLKVFATSGGSSVEKSFNDLKKSYPDLDWKSAKLLNSFNKTEIQQWISE